MFLTPGLHQLEAMYIYLMCLTVTEGEIGEIPGVRAVSGGNATDLGRYMLADGIVVMVDSHMTSVIGVLSTPDSLLLVSARFQVILCAKNVRAGCSGSVYNNS